MQAALSEATQSSTRKYELLRAAFLPFLKALDPVTAARLLLDVIMSKRSKQGKTKVNSKKSNDKLQPAQVALSNILSASNVTQQPVESPQLTAASNFSLTQQSDYSSKNETQPPIQSAAVSASNIDSLRFSLNM